MYDCKGLRTKEDITYVVVNWCIYSFVQKQMSCGSWSRMVGRGKQESRGGGAVEEGASGLGSGQGVGAAEQRGGAEPRAVLDQCDREKRAERVETGSVGWGMDGAAGMPRWSQLL